MATPPWCLCFPDLVLISWVNTAHCWAAVSSLKGSRYHWLNDWRLCWKGTSSPRREFFPFAAPFLTPPPRKNTPPRPATLFSFFLSFPPCFFSVWEKGGERGRRKKKFPSAEKR